MICVWVGMAVLSAFFAGITAILAKCGIKNTDSDVATAVRTIVVWIFSWLMVFTAGSFDTIAVVDNRSLLFLVLSGLATGASWLCYFKALSMGDVNKVVPIDKSSTVLSVLLAIIVLHETHHLLIKLVGTFLLGLGILLMVEKQTTNDIKENRIWILYAILSAVFAALTSILAKIGISGVESNLGTAIRTSIVLVMSWFVVFLKGKQRLVERMKGKEILFIVLSGLATGASWLCYYYAIQNGVVSVVVSIDKLSLVISVLFSHIVLKEKLSKRSLFGMELMTAGALVMVIFA